MPKASQGGGQSIEGSPQKRPVCRLTLGGPPCVPRQLHHCHGLAGLCLTAFCLRVSCLGSGDVLLCWEMNGKELLPDHGYPVRANGSRGPQAFRACKLRGA